jgi:deazaflavin-dependent oxidoreductase (nitroreductase family)
MPTGHDTDGVWQSPGVAAKDHPNNAPGVPMLMPPWLETFQIKFMNPLMRPFARFLPGFAIVKHRGRKSGTAYETIVSASRHGDLLSIGLMHGKTNWVKNVLAAGEAVVHVKRNDVHITNPRVVAKGDEDPSLPDGVRRMAKRVGVFVADIA